MYVRGRDDVALAAGLGFAHAHDRQTQMMIVRLAGQGRLSEQAAADDANLASDVFMRQMGFWREARRDVANLTPAARALVHAYCDGVNGYLRAHGRSVELRLLGYEPEPWEPADVLGMVGLMAYVGLAQSQQDMEKLIVVALQGGVDPARLKELLSPHLDGLDASWLEMLRRVKLDDTLGLGAARFTSAVPVGLASNNWAVAAARSATGAALLCHDPHLECNRLPAIWYEWVGHTQGDYRLGIGMPGLPGMVMGRTARVGAGFTYGFMDLVDHFVEDVQQGRSRRGDGFEPLATRTEVIARKGQPPLEITVYESSHGVLEIDGARPGPPPDGLYLARAYAGAGGAAASLNALSELPAARDVDEAMACVRRVSVSCNWLIADRSGRIAFQQSGRLPRRQRWGLYPLPGWDASCAWRGLVPPEELSAHVDPPEGVLVSANDDVTVEGCAPAINLPMAPHRAERIAALLAERDKLTVDDMKRIQRDLYSRHAERFMALLRPLLPETPRARVLGAWDLRYDKDSKGALLFERVYRRLLREVFGARLFGLEAWDALWAETGLIVEYHHLFDRVLLGDDESWYGEHGRELLLRAVLEVELAGADEPSETWGQLRQVTMKHLVLGGRLPPALGLDHGPVALEGGRATVVQSAIFRSHGRLTTFCPSYRFVTDMAVDAADTALAGGPSESRLSGLYVKDVPLWLGFGYKTLEA